MVVKVNQKFRLLVIIINYKKPKLVCDGLESLAEEIDFDTDSVVIVDNDSQDDSVAIMDAFIKTNHWGQWVDIIASKVNGGFSAGNNLGMEFVEAEYYLLLNGDAFVRAGAIDNLFKAAVSDASLGIIGPRLEWLEGNQQTSVFHNLTPVNSFLSAAKTGVLTRFAGFLGIYEVAISLRQHSVTQPEWLSFACVMLKGEMVKDIGLMDEGYFMYREDNDYCRRATASGWGLKFEPDARVVHLNKGDSNQSYLKRLPHYYFESRSRYFLKYYGRAGLLAANLFWSIGRSVSLCREFVQRRPKAFHPAMLLDIWIGFWNQVRKL